MCLVLTCVAMVIGGDLYSRVWQWLLDVVIAHLYVGGSPISWMPRCSTASWMFFLPKCVAMEIGCDCYPRGWWCQLDVVCARVCGCGSWMWLACPYIAMIVECVWCSRV